MTAHDEPIPVLEEFAERVSGSGDTGSLDGPGFLAALLEWVLGSYSAAFERIEQRLEEFDIQAMRGDGDAERTSSAWSRCGKQVGKLRRALAAHRSALVSLTHPELEALGDHASGERFQSLLRRFESTVQEARDAREAIVGSFDVLIARGGHRTNEIMKVLTLTSVILLPGALIAGVMGMNFKVGLFDDAGAVLGRARPDRRDRTDHDRLRQALGLDLARAALVPQAHAVLPELLLRHERELPQRELAVRERRAGADEGGRDGQDQLVEQVRGQELGARSPPPTSHVRSSPREPISCTSSATSPREPLDRLRARDLGQLLRVRDDPGRLAAVRPRAVARP